MKNPFSYAKRTFSPLIILTLVLSVYACSSPLSSEAPSIEETAYFEAAVPPAAEAPAEEVPGGQQGGNQGQDHGPHDAAGGVGKTDVRGRCYEEWLHAVTLACAWESFSRSLASFLRRSPLRNLT